MVNDYLMGVVFKGGDMGAKIKSIQLLGVVGSGEHTINEVDTDKTVLILGGKAINTSAYPTSDVYVQLISSTTVSVSTGYGTAVTISVIEFESGVSVQRGLTNVPSGYTYVDVTINEVDLDRAIPSGLGGVARDHKPYYYPWAFLLNSTTLRVQAFADSDVSYLSWEVIGFA